MEQNILYSMGKEGASNLVSLLSESLEPVVDMHNNDYVICSCAQTTHTHPKQLSKPFFAQIIFISIDGNANPTLDEATNETEKYTFHFMQILNSIILLWITHFDGFTKAHAKTLKLGWITRKQIILSLIPLSITKSSQYLCSWLL